MFTHMHNKHIAYAHTPKSIRPCLFFLSHSLEDSPLALLFPPPGDFAGDRSYMLP